MVARPLTLTHEDSTDMTNDSQTGDAQSQTNDRVPGFDPEHDDARGAGAQGRIATAYKQMQRRGDAEAAEELRHAEFGRQNAIAQSYPEFDPEHDAPNSESKITVKQVYEALREAGDDETAEHLRTQSSLGAQRNAAVTIDNERFDGENHV